MRRRRLGDAALGGCGWSRGAWENVRQLPVSGVVARPEAPFLGPKVEPPSGHWIFARLYAVVCKLA
jgi:hypothetical protein